MAVKWQATDIVTGVHFEFLGNVCHDTCSHAGSLLYLNKSCKYNFIVSSETVI